MRNSIDDGGATVGSVVSVNVSPVRRTARDDGTPVATAIFKQPVDGSRMIADAHVAGDACADLANHGGPFRAVYAYALEDYRWWEAQLGRELPAGIFGENLTLRGIDVTRALVGERWRVGGALLEVTSPRVPCFKLALALEDPGFVRTFARALRPGAYLAIVEAGDVARGDRAEVVSKPDHMLTLAEMTRIYFEDHARAADLLVPTLPPHWRTWVHERLAKATSPP